MQGGATKSGFPSRGPKRQLNRKRILGHRLMRPAQRRGRTSVQRRHLEFEQTGSSPLPAMASQHLTSGLKEEVLCPVCIDILQDPVTLDCGHNFCLKCISRIAEETTSKFCKCPLCNKSVRKNNFEPNWLLANLVEKIQVMDAPEMQPEREEERCQKHKEKFHYFCDFDGKFLCTVCRETKEHKSHNVVLIEEAAQSYQEKLQSQIQILKQKEMVIEQAKAQGERKINVFMAQVELEKQKVIKEFNQLHQALKEEENFLMSRINWLAQEGERGKNFYVTASESQLNSLRKLIDSLKARKQFPPKKLLQSYLPRSEGFRFLSPTPIPLHLEKKLSDAKSRHDFLTDYLKKCKDHVQVEGKRDKNKFCKGLSEKDVMNYSETTSQPEGHPHLSTQVRPQWPKRRPPPIPPLIPPPIPPRIPPGKALAQPPLTPTSAETRNTWNIAELKEALFPVTFDEATAHPDLTISQDLKTVTLDFIHHESLREPKHPESFYPFRCVLGSPGLSNGRQTWEAELQGPGGGACMVGVALEHVECRGFVAIEPLTGFWVLRVTGSECQAITGAGSREDLPVCPSKVGICVDYECGEVIFYDAIKNKHIYTFHTSFPGHIFPFYRLLFSGTRITLNP
ncbi:E3 ubiquitin-protein ligase TRIM31 [Galemys pyrenaicus]|uniref:E3 ubiquitin-protein ligase TRIM31 n=1 Tax=Galemys pyrenaicus TaxID=202257 RepID=A0A8J6DIH4_GALPY|nr:E3 ubiquitin-protein ligase TRIM31 [Galemys pyrenaicus]